MPQSTQKTPREAIERFIKRSSTVRTKASFASGVGCSAGRLTQIMDGARASDDLALRIHDFTDGEVSGSLLRPDIWPRPENVPPKPKGGRQ